MEENPAQNIPMNTFSEQLNYGGAQIETVRLDENCQLPVKCKRCKQIFSPLEFHNTKCYYHPGQYSDSIQIGLGWCCCREDLYPSLNFRAFFDSSDPLFSGSMKDHFEDVVKNFGEKYLNPITAQKYLTAGPSAYSKGNVQSDQKEDTSSSSSVSSSKELLVTNQGNEDEKAVAIVDTKLQNQITRFEQYYGRKTPTETLSPNEKLKFRDDPQLSPLSRESIGCTIADHHIVDEVYMKNINMFPIDMSNSQTAPKRNRPLDQEILEKKVGDTRHKLPAFLCIEDKPRETVPQLLDQPTIVQNNESSKEEEKIPQKEGKSEVQEENKTPEEKKEEKKIPDYIEHVVEKGDSLISLSLTYHVSIEAIRKANFLPNGDFIFHRKTLIIPTNGRNISPIQRGSTHETMIVSFQTQTKCTKEEAKYYLTEAEWDSTKALELFQEDKTWEQKNPTPANKFPEFQEVKTAEKQSKGKRSSPFSHLKKRLFKE